MNYDWYKIADLGEGFVKENTVTSKHVNEREICVGRNQNGYFAVSNTCPHAGGLLGEGRCDRDGNVVCPLHRYVFNPETGQSVDGRGFYVEPFPVEERPDGVYVGFRRKKLFGLF